MTNLEKYNNAFKEVFGVEQSVLNETFTKDNVQNWDSVHQLNIVAMMEECFDIFFDPEDIMDMTSYIKGKEILNKYAIEL